jgi:hypothetical protein
MKRRASDDLLVLTKTYDLLLWYTSHISRFPRQHRYSLGQRIEKHLFRVLELLTAARYVRPNRRHLEKANLRLEMLRIQTRLAKDLQCLKGRGLTSPVRPVTRGGVRRTTSGVLHTASSSRCSCMKSDEGKSFSDSQVGNL